MRSIVLLSIFGLVAAGEPTLAEKGQCLVDSGEAVSDAMDAALFIWASTKRCGKVGLELKCEIDIASAIKSVNSMINVILGAVDKCDALHTVNKDCGLQAGKMTEYIAGLTAAAGVTAQKCPHPAPNNPVAMGALASPVLCTVSLKNTAKHLFKAVKALTATKAKCNGDDSKACARNALEVIASIAGMGEYLAGAVGQCQRATGAATKDTRSELCAQAAQALVHHTAKVAEAGIALSTKCHPAAAPALAPIPDMGTVIIDEQQPRLYEQDGMKAAGAPVMNLVLGAFLPVTAIVGFVGGRLYANHRSRTEIARELVSDGE